VEGKNVKLTKCRSAVGPNELNGKTNESNQVRTGAASFDRTAHSRVASIMTHLVESIVYDSDSQHLLVDGPIKLEC